MGVVMDGRCPPHAVLGVLLMKYEPEHIALQVYAEAADFFGQLSPRYGYKILYGPPHHQAPILFIGYQPGGSTPEEGDKCWSPVCEYASEPWKLAVKMREMLGREFLKQCCGLNGIFVRAPDTATYKREYRDSRPKIERFCLECVGRLVDAIDPQKIVLIGLATLDLFGGGRMLLSNSDDRILLKEGRVANRPAIATMHLSGAQISTQDFNAIGAELRK